MLQLKESLSGYRDWSNKRLRLAIWCELKEGSLSCSRGLKFKDNTLAIGKLGVVEQAGKDDKLIGDSKASQASPFCQVQ